MIVLVWWIWMFVNLFNVIILMNFAIAIISETYEEVFGEGNAEVF